MRKSHVITISGAGSARVPALVGTLINYKAVSYTHLGRFLLWFLNKIIGVMFLEPEDHFRLAFSGQLQYKGGGLKAVLQSGEA